MVTDVPTSLLMYISYRAAAEQIFAALHAAGHEDLTVAQGRLLMGVDPDGTRLSVLADRAQVAKQTATALVDKLEHSGYVERVRDPADGRARLVRMTARGRSAVPVARAEEGRIDTVWAQHLGAERMAQLRAALEDLREITDPYR